MATVLISGGTGLVGTALSKALRLRGYTVIILTRDTSLKSEDPGISYANWDPGRHYIDKLALKDADYIVHLAGASVATKRWTKDRKKVIIDSRVETGKLIAGTLAGIPHQVKGMVSASAIGWYGPDPEVPNLQPFTEDVPAAGDFLGRTSQLWEDSVQPVKENGVRLVTLRIGIVLSKKGGALSEFIRPLKWGIAAIPGNGKQVISWVHLDDLVNIIIASIENKEMEGVFNAVAPSPVFTKTLVRELARLKRRFFIPVFVPAFFLKWYLGEMSSEVLKSATVSCAKLLHSGFSFQYPYIGQALAAETLLQGEESNVEE